MQHAVRQQSHDDDNRGYCGVKLLIARSLMLTYCAPDPPATIRVWPSWSRGRRHGASVEGNVQCGTMGRAACGGHAARLLCQNDGEGSQQGETVFACMMARCSLHGCINSSS